MIRYTLLVPQRNMAHALAEQIPALRQALDLLALPYEVLCVDDGSAPATRAELERLCALYPFLHVLQLEQPAGLGAALTAGIAAARGEIIVATTPAGEYPAEKILHLIAALSRGDLVCARRSASPLTGACRWAACLPRRLLLASNARDPGCPLWAARRETVAGLELRHGMSRYLDVLVAARGFRVAEVMVPAPPARPALRDAGPNLGTLLALWWLKGRRPIAGASELPAAVAAGAAVPLAHSRWIQAAAPSDRKLRRLGDPERRRDIA